MELFEELKWRGLVDNVTSEEVEDVINNGEVTFYIGTDPTGDSMHIGHFSSFLIATRLKRAGHNPILLVGGGTGLIGDPKPTAERAMISYETVNHNVECLTKQAKDIFGFEVVNNYDWLKNINFIDFLRDYGKYFSIGYMLDKDIIKRRLDAGITYTEFSYMIMQAMDFEHLYNERGVTMQVAGQDQWGNITAGIELIRKKDGKEAFAFTMPLITKSDGTKFGKTEGKAIWLDKNKTTPYEMYQFFVNVEDSMVIDYLKKFTFLSKEEIEKIEKEHNLHPEERLAHKTLAKEVITFIHGEKAYEDALKQANALFNGDISSLGAENLLNEFKDVPHFIVIENENILDMLIRGKICSSKREAREMVSAGAISINGNKETNLDKIITGNDLIEGKVLLLKKGKKNYFLGTK